MLFRFIVEWTDEATGERQKVMGERDIIGGASLTPGDAVNVDLDGYPGVVIIERIEVGSRKYATTFYCRPASPDEIGQPFVRPVD